MSINGKAYSWEDITITLPHGVLIGIQDIEYSDKKETNAEYGKGSVPIGYSEGNYSAEVKFTLLLEEAKKFNDAMKLYPAFYRHKPFPIVVSYANEDERTLTDVLPSVKITERKNSAKQGDKGIATEFSGIILDPIEYDGLKACDY
ncbi:hypothetical protein [Anaerosinus gibii]|uniref:Phage tail protein n=1 Tax=Selenobaculum gibii TaxID=3054208 RepID=A0A9Y2EV73_9FIRM|nr:hypothetical protein [Selenobaculum gbiensis]WIW70609.1 hypothetical protein P3F81_12095 [Selenobaculum gbiensis]